MFLCSLGDKIADLRPAEMAEFIIVRQRCLRVAGLASILQIVFIKLVLNIISSLEDFLFYILGPDRGIGFQALVIERVRNEFHGAQEFCIKSPVAAQAMPMIGKGHFIHVKEAQQKIKFLVGGSAGNRAESHDQKESQ